MPRPEKYSSPEMRDLAHDYHMGRRQQELRDKILAKLGGKCVVCGSNNPDHLKLCGSASKNWNKRWADVKTFPHLFTLQCANCSLEAVQFATRIRLKDMADILLKDTLRNGNESRPADKTVTVNPIRE
jgi:hypothetical protein